MHVETPHLAITLPPGFRQEGPRDDLTFVDDRLSREITLTSFTADESANVPEVLRRLADHRRSALENAAGLAHMSDVALLANGHRHEASFLAAGDDPMLAFAGLVLDARPLLGRLHGATFSCYQHASPTLPPPDVEAFAQWCRAALTTLVPAPQRDVLARASAAAPTEPNTVKDPSRLYPYLVPRAYVDAQTTPGPAPRSIGNGLYLAIAEDFEGAVAVQYAERLRGLGDADQILALAQKNLVAALRAGKLPIQAFDGPKGHRVLVFGPEWRAASCLFLPDLFTFAGSNIGAGPLLAAVPHRDALLVFRDVDAAYRDEMRAFIAKNEADGPKPLTAGLFRLSGEGVEAIG